MTSTTSPSDDTNHCPGECKLAATGAVTGAILVAAERARQVNAEGWTIEHDREHGPRVLLSAAVCYARAEGPRVPLSAALWPWHASYWKPKGALRNLVRAGALVQAAIDLDLDGSVLDEATSARDRIVADIDVLLAEARAALT